jgi:hypothetical protein
MYYYSCTTTTTHVLLLMSHCSCHTTTTHVTLLLLDPCMYTAYKQNRSRSPPVIGVSFLTNSVPNQLSPPLSPSLSPPPSLPLSLSLSPPQFQLRGRGGEQGAENEQHGRQRLGHGPHFWKHQHGEDQRQCFPPWCQVCGIMCIRVSEHQ